MEFETAHPSLEETPSEEGEEEGEQQEVVGRESIVPQCN
jgi:hypothetical protein